MLLVVLYKDEKAIPLDLLENDAIASTVLNSVKNQNYEYNIFHGNTDNLAALSQNIATILPSANLKSSILKLAKNFNCEERDFSMPKTNVKAIVENLKLEGLKEESALKLISHVLESGTDLSLGNYTFGYINQELRHNIIASLPTEVIKEETWENDFKRSPGKTTYPSAMNKTDLNKKAWQYVIKCFSKKIRETYPESLGRQWVYAMILYQRVCLKLKIRPWEQFKTVDNTQTIRDKIKLDEERCDIFIDEIFNDLLESKLVLRLEDLRFLSVEKQANKYIINFSRKLIIPTDIVASTLFDHLKSIGWTRSRNCAMLEVSNLTDLSLVSNDKEELKFIIEMTLPNVAAEALVESKEDVQNKIKKLMNVWLSTGRLKFRKKDLI